jgi:glucose-1-phosphate thymidylyltransferase
MHGVKGVILAGGNGTRLHPMTEVVSKQLLPVYDKPMIYYPLTTLIQMGIKDILIISTPHDIGRFELLLGDGSRYGVSLNYAVQNSPDGIAQAFVIAESFLGDGPSCLILGDNLFLGDYFNFSNLSVTDDCSTVFSYEVDDPERYGVVEFDSHMNAIRIIEKPNIPISNFAVTGLYFYDNNAVYYVKTLQKSNRGEYEITDLNNIYLSQGKLKVEIIKSSNIWSDMGTPRSLKNASDYIHQYQRETLELVGSPEIAAFRNGWLNSSEIIEQIKSYKSDYYEKIRDILKVK